MPGPERVPGRSRPPLRTALLAVLLAVLLAGCGVTGGTARGLDDDEAQRLAVSRFRNFDAGVRAVQFSIEGGVEPVRFSGWFDFTTGIGYGTLQAGAGAEGQVVWNSAAVAVRTTGGTGPAVPPVPDREALEREWAGRQLAPGTESVDAVMAMVGSLGGDRPDNPLLLQQSDSRWVGTATVGGEELDLIDVPAPATAASDAAARLRYWIDATGVMARVEAYRSGEDAPWSTIDFSAADGVELGNPFVDAEAVR